MFVAIIVFCSTTLQTDCKITYHQQLFYTQQECQKMTEAVLPTFRHRARLAGKLFHKATCADVTIGETI
jgi:hypothetical protein